LTGEDRSIAIRAAMIHVIGDIMQSVGVCVAAACIWAFSDRWLDENGLSYW
jgi:zinc transporter 2